MKMIKLTYNKLNLTLWISSEEIAYLSRENEKPKSSILKVQEDEEFTIVALKSGRNIMVDQLPEDIVASIEVSTGTFDSFSGVVAYKDKN